MSKLPQLNIYRWIGVTWAVAFLMACGPQSVSDENLSPHMLIFAGDQDEKDSDFIMMIDVDPKSETRGQPITTQPIGHKMSMPHHMEYVAPPKGEPIFMNAHHHELSMIVDTSTPGNLLISKTFKPPAPFRFPHDYTRTPSGTRLIGYLRSDGPSPDPEETTQGPAGHGGIAEYTMDGALIRTVSAAIPDATKAIRPYAFALLPEVDRFAVTSAPMMESSWADVIQIYSYSDFELLHTIELPIGRLPNGKEVEGSQAAGFGPRVLGDGSVFLNSYGCAFYHLTDIGTDEPKLDMVYVLKTPKKASSTSIRGACGIPFQIGQYWIQPVGRLNAVVVLDISNPASPKEVSRLGTPDWFRPHWLAKDPKGNRLILGAELGGEEGFFMLRFDAEKGRLRFDKNFSAKSGNGLFARKRDGYISLRREEWPHGDTGIAWGHAALFLESE